MTFPYYGANFATDGNGVRAAGVVLFSLANRTLLYSRIGLVVGSDDMLLEDNGYENG